jgi:hypothetical protein
MPIELVVSTQDPSTGPLVLPDGSVMRSVLSEEPEEAVATTYISDLLTRLFSDVSDAIDFDCSVEVSVAGSLKLVGKGGVKLYVLNVGGQIEGQTSMTVKLATRISPRREQEEI